jgi:hypothetical protein
MHAIPRYAGGDSDTDWTSTSYDGARKTEPVAYCADNDSIRPPPNLQEDDAFGPRPKFTPRGRKSNPASGLTRPPIRPLLLGGALESYHPGECTAWRTPTSPTITVSSIEDEVSNKIRKGGEGSYARSGMPWMQCSTHLPSGTANKYLQLQEKAMLRCRRRRLALHWLHRRAQASKAL